MTASDRQFPKSSSPRGRTGRLAIVDMLRGFAIIAMVIYHLSWDLSWFGYVDWAVSTDPAWRGFAAAIAGSFLFLSGVSLRLAHGTGIRWTSFLRREAILVAAAAAVSLITWTTFGPSMVRFGILHCMAVSSVMALVAVTRPPFMALGLGAALLALGFAPPVETLAGDLWLWTGLGVPDSDAVDYVPLIPWSGLVFLGLGLAGLLTGWLEQTATGRRKALTALDATAGASRLGRLLRLLGRKSLPIYLLHQPLLYGTVWVIALVFGAPDRDAIAFIDGCQASCAATYGDAEACRAACTCTQSDMEGRDAWARLVEQPEDPVLREDLNTTYASCLRQTPPAGLLPPAAQSD